MEVQNLTADKILRATCPGDVFTNNLTIAKKEYRALLKLWHPDINKTVLAEEVSKRVTELFKGAVTLLEIGKWETTGQIEVGTNSHKFRIRYKKHSKFELGDMYIGDKIVAYIIDKTQRDLCVNYQGFVSSFNYASDNMKGEFSRYLPKLINGFDIDNQVGLIVDKTPDLLSLRDVLNYFGGKLDPRHVAWIMSGLHNITCYLDWAGLSHNDISLDTYFISPKYHSGALLGGWWYTSNIGEKLVAVPNRTYQYMPMAARKTKISSIKTDLELIRVVGRELLGDVTGTRLKQNEEIPRPLINWLVLPSPTGSAIKDYTLWDKVLADSFGPRKFVKMEVTAKELYHN